jgi:hypothetical protein
MEERDLYLRCAMRKKNMLQCITGMHRMRIVFSIRNLGLARDFHVTFSGETINRMQLNVSA